MSRKFALVISTVALILPAMLPVAQALSPPGTAYGGPGLLETQLMAGQTINAGTVSFWNSNKKAMVQIEASGDWEIAAVHRDGCSPPQQPSLPPCPFVVPKSAL